MATLKLVKEGSVELKRPNYFDEEVTNNAIEKLLPELLAFIGVTENHGEDYVEQVRTDVFNAIEFEDDGYDICRHLDNATWDIDADTVEFMDNNVSSCRYDAHKEIEAQWVKDNNIRPKHSIGDVIKFNHPSKSLQPVGEVVVMDEKQGRYLVFSEELGHVRTGVGSHGIYVVYESVVEK